MKKAAILLGLLVAGCASNQTETVYLARDQQRTQCGPYQFSPEEQFAGTAATSHAEIQLRQCVLDFQKAGYERVQGP